MNPTIITLSVLFRFGLKEINNKLQKILDSSAQETEYEINSRECFADDEELNYYMLDSFSLKLRRESSGILELYIIFEKMNLIRKDPLINNGKKKTVKVWTFDDIDNFHESISDIKEFGDILGNIFFLIISDPYRAMSEGYFIHPYNG